MHYYVDGYNLLFSCVPASDNLQKHRQALILNLEEKIQLLALDVTLVFDAQFQPEIGYRFHFKCLEIYFTDLGVTADDFILQQLKNSSNPSQETVVTSDKTLAWRCRQQEAHTIDSELFVAWLSKRSKNKYRQNMPKTSPPKTLPSCTLTPLKPIPIKEKLPLSSPSPLENPQASLEACFDAYLDIFQKNTPTPVVKQTRTDAPKKRRIKHADPLDNTPHDPLESEFQRWLKIFEKKEK